MTLELQDWLRGLPVFCAVFGLALLAGCDLFGGSGSATVRVLLTDAPFPFEMVDSANVTIERVELVSESEGVINVTSAWTEPRAFNLLDLRHGITALLGEVEIPEGTYEQARLILTDDAEVVMNEESGGTTYTLAVPSGSQTGVKVLLDSLRVESESYVTLTLDFDVSESFVILGDASSPANVNGFNFNPVVKLLQVELGTAAETTSE